MRRGRNIMFDLKYTYKNMPKDTIEVPGMKIIQGNTKEVHVKIPKDIEYAVKDQYPLHIRMMIPEVMDIEHKYPLYIHVQGSAWYEQNLNDHIVDLSPICKAGYVIAIIQYRPSNLRTFPAQVEDIKTAVRFLILHQDDYPIDIQQIYLGGDSSGGHIAMMCYATWNEPLFDAERSKLPKINAFLDFYGPINFITEADQISGIDRSKGQSYPEADLLKLNDVRLSPEKVKEANPITYIQKDKYYPPLLIMHGNKDRLVPFRQSVELFQHVQNLNHDVTFYQIDDADHGGSCFWSNKTIEVIIHFLKKNQK